MVQFSLQRMRAPVAAMQMRNVRVAERPPLQQIARFRRALLLASVLLTSSSVGLLCERERGHGSKQEVVARSLLRALACDVLALALTASDRRSSYYSAGEQPTRVWITHIRSFIRLQARGSEKS